MPWPPSWILDKTS